MNRQPSYSLVIVVLAAAFASAVGCAGEDPLAPGGPGGRTDAAGPQPGGTGGNGRGAGGVTGDVGEEVARVPDADPDARGDRAVADAAGDTFGASDSFVPDRGQSLPPLPPPPMSVCQYPSTRQVMVADARALKLALAGATAGDRIELGPATYPGKFLISASGSAERPIVLCGPRSAVLDGGGGGYTLHIQGDWIVVSGITISNGLKNIMVDGASDNLLRDLEVSGSLQEGVHFRMGSSRNTIADSFIHHTGLRDPGFGEGVYIGSAGAGDRSDHNRVIGNRITDNAAEGIDVKEGTTGGIISGNTFDGAGQKGVNFGDSLIDVKGTRYIVEKNRGAGALLNAFEVHSIGGAADSGHDNVFRDNILTVTNPMGVGIWLDVKARGNVVSCTNRVTGGAGLSTAACGD